MVDRATLEALRERVRKAEGPDRELDEAICLGVFPDLRPAAPHCVGDDPIFWDEPFYKKRPPKLTASIDAAVALVGQAAPGWSFAVRKSGFGDPAQADLWNPMKSPGGGNNHRAKDRRDGSIPLALLDALLTALLMEPSDD